MIDLLHQNYIDLIHLLKKNNASKKVLAYTTNLIDILKTGIIDEHMIKSMILGIHPFIIKIMLPELLEQLTLHKTYRTKRKSLKRGNTLSLKGGANGDESVLTKIINWFWELLCHYIKFDI